MNCSSEVKDEGTSVYGESGTSIGIDGGYQSITGRYHSPPLVPIDRGGVVFKENVVFETVCIKHGHVDRIG